MRPAFLGRVAIAIAVLAGFCFTGAEVRGALELPGIPADRGFIQDYAGVLSPDVGGRVENTLREAFRTYDTPIVVVTINRMADYGGAGFSIEDFAYEWFNHWEIGKRGADGELINRGILLLVSTGDRSARIELGADWGRAWDDHCSRIMDRLLVPEFRDGDYTAGVVAGIEALAEMAETGPDGSPPRGLGDLRERLQESPFETTPLPLWASGIMLLGGVGVIAMVFIGKAFHILFPVSDAQLIGIGIGLIVGAFVLWVLLLVLASFLPNSDGYGGWGSSGGGSFGSAGGFGGGGFSGGGGASGSW